MGFGDLGFWGLGFWGFRVLGFLGFSLREHKKCVHIVTASLPVPMSIFVFLPDRFRDSSDQALRYNILVSEVVGLPDLKA